MDQSLTPAAADDKKANQQSSSEFTVSDVGPHLDRLWSYQCSTTKGRNVSCIGWNVTNPVCTSQTSPADSNAYSWREMYSGHAGLVALWKLPRLVPPTSYRFDAVLAAASASRRAIDIYLCSSSSSCSSSCGCWVVVNPSLLVFIKKMKFTHHTVCY